MQVLKRFGFFIFTITITGCSGTMERMSGWMGVDRSALLDQLGEPHEISQSQFGTVYSWYRNDEDKNGCTDQFTLRNHTIISFASNCGVFGGWGTPAYRVSNGTTPN